MFFLSSADLPRLGTSRSAAGLLGAGLLLSFVITQAGCGKKSTAAPPPKPVATEPRVEVRDRPSGPAWEPQTREELPPVQPIPAEAVTDAPAPLRVERAEPAENPPVEPSEDTPPPVERTETAAEPVPNPPVPFRLGVILSAEERAQHNRMIDRDLVMAEQSLSRVLATSGSQERNAQVKRVRAFMKQAEEVRRDDLPLARNLAGRARLLAEDLAGGAR